MIPEWLLGRTEISAGAKIVYALLLRHRCEPDYPRYEIASGIKENSIAKEIGASERSVRNWIKELEGAKLLYVQVLGWGRPNLYHFLKHPWQGRPHPGSRKQPE